ncbi:unnamed protein product [Triticum turgidum subsp. durum]|uniref:Uncharacterized protein n=1 Tax=Triticum turgidum subsp. durum TaxID=4567 RepID=A0A9R1QWH4_TRITD|nr:unnamed protein product [Triticum turgidum subsp. durum]
MAATATEASTTGSSSPRTSFVADSLILPTRNGRLFASTFALVYAHTFVSLSVAVLYAHPLATAVLLRVYSLVRDNDGGPGRSQHVVYASESDDEIRGHAKKLLVVYLAYLASQLATRRAPDAGMVGVLHVYLLPSIGVQLFSTVAAAVFYHRCMEHHHDPAVLQPTTKLAIAKSSVID